MRIFVKPDDRKSGSRANTNHHGSSSSRRQVTEKNVKSFSGSEVDSGGASGSILCKIKSKVGGQKYLADVYGDGYVSDSAVPYAATAIDQPIFVVNLSASAVLPADTWIYASIIDGHYEGTATVWQ